jgi:hypothetical protein
MARNNALLDRSAKYIFFILLLLVLVGCSSLPIPTGKTITEFLNPNKVSVLATDLKSVQYNESFDSLTLTVVQYRLQQKFKVPYVYDGTVRLDFGRAIPIDEFRWQKQPPLTLGQEWIIKTPDGSQYRVKPAYFAHGAVVLDLDSALKSLPTDTNLSLICPECRPNLSDLSDLNLSVPPPPNLNTELSFSLDKRQLSAMRGRVRAEAALVARQAQEQKRLDRETEIKLARDIKERESQERRAAEELVSKQRKAAADRKRELTRVAREGDGSSDDLLCKKYGFKPNTQAYASCRMQIDVAKREMQQQQAMYEAQQQQIQQAQEAERKRRQSDFLLGMGLRMMGGQSASGAAIDQSVGAPMYQPPPPSSRTYTFPNGRMMTCTSSGSNTNCF